MADVLDKGCLHLLRLLGALVGLLQFLHVLATGQEDIEECHDEQDEQGDGTHQSEEAYTISLPLGFVEPDLVSDSLHAVDQHDVVDRVVRGCLVLQGLIGLLPSARLLEDHHDGVSAFVTQFLLRQGYGLVYLALMGQIVHLE